MLPPSARRRPRAARRPRSRVLAAAGVLLLAVAGCASSGGGGSSSGTPSARPTPITQLSTTGMEVPRIDFCRLVPTGAVREALGTKPASDASWGSGDSEPASGAGDQVLHEIGCSWTAADGSVARAWVFARPVDAAFARTVVQAAATKGCRAVAGPAFGSPTLTQRCTPAQGAARVRHAGLFGQTWLTCEVAGAPGTAVEQVGSRADAWCVQVAESLNTRS